MVMLAAPYIGTGDGELSGIQPADYLSHRTHFCEYFQLELFPWCLFSCLVYKVGTSPFHSSSLFLNHLATSQYLKNTYHNTMKLAFTFTPPSTKSPLSKMPPEHYLQSSPVQMRLKRELSIDDVDTDRLRLDPSYLTDEKSIFEYQYRVSQLLSSDRQKIHIHYELKDTFEMNVLL